MYLGGQIHPVVGKTLRLEEAPAGLRELAERKILGKAVLTMEAPGHGSAALPA
jgi:hypothetical protein